LKEKADTADAATNPRTTMCRPFDRLCPALVPARARVEHIGTTTQSLGCG
jgi:hypothetical protein